jgi:hypothetical protein
MCTLKQLNWQFTYVHFELKCHVLYCKHLELVKFCLDILETSGSTKVLKTLVII